MVFVLMLYLFGFLPSVLKDVPHPPPRPVGHLPKCQVKRLSVHACVRAFVHAQLFVASVASIFRSKVTCDL